MRKITRRFLFLLGMPIAMLPATGKCAEKQCGPDNDYVCCGSKETCCNDGKKRSCSDGNGRCP
jgi:hypothetical protein